MPDLVSPDFIDSAADRVGVPRDIAQRLIQTESGGRVDAVSPKGAVGPAQLMPGTARELGLDDQSMRDPRLNVEAGLRLLRTHYDRFGNWRDAAAAYQAGPGAVERAGGVPDTSDGIMSTADYADRVAGPQRSDDERLQSLLQNPLFGGQAGDTGDTDALAAQIKDRQGSGFGKNLVRGVVDQGWTGTKALAGGALAAVTRGLESVVGKSDTLNNVASYGQDVYQTNEGKIQAAARETDSPLAAWQKAKETGSIQPLIDGLGYAVGGALGFVAGTAATGGVGSAGLKLLGKAAVEKAATKAVAAEAERLAASNAAAGLSEEALHKMAVSNVAGRWGELAGGTAFNVSAGVGQTFEDAKQANNGEDPTDMTRVLGLGALSGVIGEVGALTGLKGLGQQIEQNIAKLPFAGRVAASTAAMGLTGATTGVGMTALQRAGAGKDLTGDEANQAYGNAALGMGVGMAPFGAVRGAMLRPSPARAPVQAPHTAESVHSILSAPDVDTAIQSAVDGLGGKIEEVRGFIDELLGDQAPPPQEPGGPMILHPGVQASDAAGQMADQAFAARTGSTHQAVQDASAQLASAKMQGLADQMNSIPPGEPPAPVVSEPAGNAPMPGVSPIPARGANGRELKEPGTMLPSDRAPAPAGAPALPGPTGRTIEVGSDGKVHELPPMAARRADEALDAGSGTGRTGEKYVPGGAKDEGAAPYSDTSGPLLSAERDNQRLAEEHERVRGAVDQLAQRVAAGDASPETAAALANASKRAAQIGKVLDAGTTIDSLRQKVAEAQATGDPAKLATAAQKLAQQTMAVRKAREALLGGIGQREVAERVAAEQRTPPSAETLAIRKAAGDKNLEYRAADPHEVQPHIGNTVAQIARLFGKKVAWYTKDSDEGGFVNRGAAPDTIFLNTKGREHPLAVFGHELFHHIAKDSPEVGRAFMDVVKSNLPAEKMAEFERYYGAGANHEELSADLFGNRLAESEFWHDVYAKVQNPTLVARIMSSIGHIVDTLVKAFRGPKYRSDEFVNNLEAIRTAAKDALRQYADERRMPAAAMEGRVLRELPGAKRGLAQAGRDSQDRERQNGQGTTGNAESGVAGAIRRAENGGPGAEGERGRPDSEREPAAAQERDGERRGDGQEPVQGKVSASVREKLIGIAKGMGVTDRDLGLLDKNGNPLFSKYRETANGQDAQARDAGERGGPQQSAARDDVEGGRRSAGEAARGIQVRATHYSGAERAVLDSGRYGTGLRGAESERVAASGDDRLKHRIYFYGNEGQGVEPEVGVGHVRHEFDASGLYDLTSDPDRLYERLGQDKNKFESAVLDAGYQGYYTRGAMGKQGAGVLLGERQQAARKVGYGPAPARDDVPASAAAQDSARPKPLSTLSEFRADPKAAFDKTGWAILTGTREDLGAHDTPENQTNNQRLAAELKRDGIPFQRISGSYKGEDQGPSFLIQAPRNEAMALGKKYGQESILTNEGLVYQDGSVTPRVLKDDVIGPEAAKADFHSVLPDGTPFSLGLDFDRRVGADGDDVQMSRARKPLEDADAERAVQKLKADRTDPRQTRAWASIERALTPEERAKVTRATAEKMVAQITKLPSAKEMAAIAWAGKAKRGWYAESAKAISNVFGPDSDRFAGLLAALSPQCSVEDNLKNTVSTWRAWVAEGRPTERAAIVDIMGRSVQGKGTEESVLDAWKNNAVRILSAEDPSTTVLSGPKVNSFMQNLRGVVHEVTNDTWMANYAGVKQTMFSGSLNERTGDPGKRPGYLTFNARVRQAAAELSDRTGETWTPAEVQETIWSWAKTLAETARGEGMTAREFLENSKLTDALINSTPDFRTLFHDEAIEPILRDAGYGPELDDLRSAMDHGEPAAKATGAESQAEPFAADDQRRHELRAAERLDKVARQRERERARGRAGKDAADAAGGGRGLQEEVVRSSARLSPSEIRDIAAGEAEDPNFKAWFKDSQMREPDGTPSVLFHGPGVQGIRTFEPSADGLLGPGIYVTPGHDYASSYAKGGEAIPLFARIEKPLRITDTGRDDIQEQIATAPGIVDQFFTKGHALRWARDQKENYAGIGDEDFKQMLRDAGYDGVVLQDKDGNVKEATVLSSSQLKHATENSGEYGSRVSWGGDYGDIYRSSDRHRNDDGTFASHETVYSGGRSSLGTLTPDQAATAERVFGRPKTLAERFQEFRNDWQTKLVQGVFDEYKPLEKVSPTGYMLSRLSKGTSGPLEALTMYGPLRLDKDGVTTVDYKKGQFDGFAKVLAKLGGEQDRFFAWVTGLRADKLKAIGLENLMSDDDIKNLKTLADGQMDDGSSRRQAFADALQGLNRFNDNVLDIAEKSGLIDAQTRAMYRDTPYVPFYRLHDEDVVGGAVTAGLVNQSAWKSLKGGTEKINENQLGSVMANWSHLLDAAAKNRAAQRSLADAEVAGIATRLPSGAPGGKNAVAIKIGGRDVQYHVSDPLVLSALQATQYKGMSGPLAKIFTAPKHWLTMAATKSPAFLTRIALRDALQAQMNGQALSWNTIGNMIQGWQGSAKDSETRAKLLAGGGFFNLANEGLDATGIAKKSISDLGGIVLDSPDAANKFFGRLDRAWQGYKDVTSRAEGLSRIPLYENLIDQGFTHAQAIYLARDLMDYSSQGKWAAVRYISSMVPFMNAHLQALYKMGRSTTDPETRGRAVAMIGAVSAASVALMLAQRDDDQWQKRQDWDRQTYWGVHIGDTMLRIPKPFELGSIGTIAEMGTEAILNSLEGRTDMPAKRFERNLADIFLNDLAMNPVPQTLKPLLDLYSNENAFTHTKIETDAQQKELAADRVNANTSEAARLIGKLGLPDPTQLIMAHQYKELSPVQVDSLVRGYLNWFGDLANGAFDELARHTYADRGERPMLSEDQIAKKVVGPWLTSDENDTGSRYVTDMYQKMTDAEQAHGSLQAAVKSGDTDRAQDIMSSRTEDLDRYKSLEHLKSEESRISKMMRQITDSTSLSGATKQAMLRQLAEAKDRLSRGAQ